MHVTRVGNLLGAMSLAISDKMVGVATASAAVSPSAVGALVLLKEIGPMGVSRLGQCVGVTQSAATRLVDALEHAGLTRRIASSGRERVVELAPAGETAARAVLDERAQLLAGLITDTLDASESEVLERVLGKLLRGLYELTPNSALLCRFCDRQACTESAVCPVGKAERDHEPDP